MNIENTSELKTALRNGKYAWPGGYPVYFFTADGAALSFEAVMDNYRQVLWSVKTDTNDGWQVIGTDINYENCDLYCDHTGDKIEAAYC